jgi:Glycosyltransferase family 87
LIGSCALYFFLFGVLSLAWSADGDDLLIFHAAGGAALQGLNPYTPGRFSDPFSYPPAWVPFCVVLSLLPATAAIWVWKIFNVIFLIGSVYLSLQLMFREREPTPAQRTIVWCFAFLLWPTSIAVFDGNTPLFILFFALLGLRLSTLGRPYAAGICLAFSLIKPNIVLPLFAFLFADKQYRVIATALVTAGLLTLWGIHLTGIGIGEYVVALKVYNAANAVIDSSSVGLAKLIAIVGGVGSEKARLIAMGVGALVILTLFALSVLSKSAARSSTDPALPVFLLTGIAFLGARGYDLVFVIPVFVWLISLARDLRWLAWPALLLAATFLVPQRAIEIAYERLLSKFLPAPVFDVLLSPYRSWALLILVLWLALLFVRLDRDSQLLRRASL